MAREFFEQSTNLSFNMGLLLGLMSKVKEQTIAMRDSVPEGDPVKAAAREFQRVLEPALEALIEPSYRLANELTARGERLREPA